MAETISTSEACLALKMTSRQLLPLLQSGRIKAEIERGRWRIDSESLNSYAAQKANGPEYMTIDQACERLGETRQRVMRMINLGLLKCAHVDGRRMTTEQWIGDYEFGTPGLPKREPREY
jgi:hypothetical protein